MMPPTRRRVVSCLITDLAVLDVAGGAFHLVVGEACDVLWRAATRRAPDGDCCSGAALRALAVCLGERTSATDGSIRTQSFQGVLWAYGVS